MFRIIIVVLLVNYINLSLAQDSLSKQLLAFEQDIYSQEDVCLKQKLILTKIDFLIEHELLNSLAFMEVKRIQVEFLDRSETQRFLWNASIISYFNNEIYHSIHYLKDYSKEDSSVLNDFNFNFFSFLNYKNYDSVKANAIKQFLISQDAIFENLECFDQVEEFQLRHKKLKLNASLFIPGLGAALNGNVLKGFTSLGLNTVSAVAIFYLLRQNMYINSILWGSNLIGKFYLGGVRMTEKFVSQKELVQKNKLAENCELKISTILEKYPLTFK
jgi:hypothetical protein